MFHPQKPAAAPGAAAERPALTAQLARPPPALLRDLAVTAESSQANRQPGQPVDRPESGGSAASSSGTPSASTGRRPSPPPSRSSSASRSTRSARPRSTRPRPRSSSTPTRRAPSAPRSRRSSTWAPAITGTTTSTTRLSTRSSPPRAWRLAVVGQPRVEPRRCVPDERAAGRRAPRRARRKRPRRSRCAGGSGSSR